MTSITSHFIPETFIIRPYEDPMAKRVGFQPNTEYVDRFWLPILGPTSVCLLRLSKELLQDADLIEISSSKLATRLGLPNNLNKLIRTMKRLCYFDLIKPLKIKELVVEEFEIRQYLYPLNAALLSLLDPFLVSEHQQFLSKQMQNCT